MTPSAQRLVALVTNVTEYAGPGIARALADAGYEVLCHDRSFEDPSVLAEYGAGGDRLHPVEHAEPEEVVEGALSRFGQLDVLVNNDFVPGAMWGEPPRTSDLPVMRAVDLEEADPGEYRETLEQLAVLPFRFCRAAVPAMKERSQGTIIFITSSASYRASPRFEMYSSARSAATCLAQGLAVQLAPHGIHVYPIGPAWFDNPTYFPTEHREHFTPRVEREVPLGRLGRQEEIGALVVFLVSGDAAPLTGQLMPFTAGTRLGYR